MKTGTIAAMAVTATVILLVSLTTGFFGWMMWALLLNGFMGQQTAVDTSQMVYFALAVCSALITIVLSVLAVHFLAARREWNAALAAILSTMTFSTAVGVLHSASVVVSAIVASQMRTR